MRAGRDQRILSVLAPPGYGKTTFLAQLATTAAPSATWLTVDGGDNDPEIFLSYLAAAIDRVEPLDPDVFAAIRQPSVSNRTIVGRLLIALQDRAEPVLVVIDDAHRVTDRACLDALAEFATYLPAPSRIAIGGREPVALPLPRWRTQGALLEIGLADLNMDDEEATELARRLRLGLSADDMRRLTRRTNGWPALLALVAISADRAPDELAPTQGADVRIADYLRSEILEGRPETEVAFLTRTSILERLSGPVCDAVTGDHGSADRLARLAGSTLVDVHAGSYGYHSLLRDFLRDELRAREPDGIGGLHRRAAAWYEAHGVLDQAVDHAFEAGDLDVAASAVGRAMVPYHWSGRRATTRAWFRRFGDAALEQRPWLAVLAAWDAIGAGDVPTADALARIAERASFQGRPPDGTASFESGRAMLRAVMCRQGADDALGNAARAVELEAAGSPWRDFALWQLALARRMTGDTTGADEALDAAIEAARSSGNAGLHYCLLGSRALLAVERGDWLDAETWATGANALGVAAYVDGYLTSAPALAASVRIAIYRGDIAEARRDLARSVNLRPLLTSASPAISVESLLAFAAAHLAIADPAGANTVLTQVRQITRIRPDLGVLPDEMAALRASLASLPIGIGGSSALTAAELRVLAFLPYYLSFKEIAERLGVKATTVKTHALAIYGKLGASTRSEAVEIAVDAGLLERFPA